MQFRFDWSKLIFCVIFCIFCGSNVFGISNFRWIFSEKYPERIAGMAIPDSADDFAFLMRNNIKLVIKLTDSGYSQSFLDALIEAAPGSIKIINFTIPDFKVPEKGQVLQMNVFFKSIAELLNADPLAKVAVHCSAGQGRTGLFLACLLVFLEECEGEMAIETVRKSDNPGHRSIENPRQEDFVRRYKKPQTGFFSRIFGKKRG